jgi:glycine dehydrogenase subunit 1
LRHFIPHTPQDKEEMLKRIGVDSFEQLLAAVPESSRVKAPLDLPAPLSELETKDLMAEIAGKNESLTCFAGGGAYDHMIPSVVDAILSRPEFYTAYTPYQAEVSQGTLQSIYEYQSMICELTGMEVSNASMYDGGSALAEAVHMAKTITGRRKVVVTDTVAPMYRRVLETYCKGLDIGVQTVPGEGGATDLDRLARAVDDETACAVLQHPNSVGCLEEPQSVADIIHRHGGLFIVSIDPLSLGLLAPPSTYDADIAVGEGQSLGLPLSFGGPFLGIFTAKRKYVRSLPGRLVGVTEDSKGQRGFVLTIQTREQHIRREKATSNICTNQALCALAACVYLAVLGKQGIVDVGELCLTKSHYLAERLEAAAGWRVVFDRPFFKEFCVEPSQPPEEVVRQFRKEGILAGIPAGLFNEEWKNCLLVAVTEKRSKKEMDEFVEIASHMR